MLKHIRGVRGPSPTIWSLRSPPTNLSDRSQVSTKITKSHFFLPLFLDRFAVIIFFYSCPNRWKKCGSRSGLDVKSGFYSFFFLLKCFKLFENEYIFVEKNAYERIAGFSSFPGFDLNKMNADPDSQHCHKNMFKAVNVVFLFRQTGDKELKAISKLRYLEQLDILGNRNITLPIVQVKTSVRIHSFHNADSDSTR